MHPRSARHRDFGSDNVGAAHQRERRARHLTKTKGMRKAQVATIDVDIKGNKGVHEE